MIKGFIEVKEDNGHLMLVNVRIITKIAECCIYFSDNTPRLICQESYDVLKQKIKEAMENDF